MRLLLSELGSDHFVPVGRCIKRGSLITPTGDYRVARATFMRWELLDRTLAKRRFAERRRLN